MFHTIKYLPQLDAVESSALSTKLVHVAAWYGNMGSGCEVRDSRAEATAIAVDWAGDENSDDDLFFFMAEVNTKTPGGVYHDVMELLDDHIESHAEESDGFKHADDRYSDNVTIVTRIMERSKYGALSQAFVIEAIGRYADACAAMTDEQVDEQDKAGAMLSYKSWRGVAQEIKAVMDKRYNRNTTKQGE